MSLNPYCSGRWSRTVVTHANDIKMPCLNPYCSGRWSRTLAIIKAANQARGKS